MTASVFKGYHTQTEKPNVFEWDKSIFDPCTIGLRKIADRILTEIMAGDGLPAGNPILAREG